LDEIPSCALSSIKSDITRITITAASQTLEKHVLPIILVHRLVLHRRVFSITPDAKGQDDGDDEDEKEEGSDGDGELGDYDDGGVVDDHASAALRRPVLWPQVLRETAEVLQGAVLVAGGAEQLQDVRVPVRLVPGWPKK